MLLMIVAHDKKMLIGNDNKLPWPSISEDMKFFKKITTNENVVMGRKTFDSIFSYIKKPLPNRESFVITRNKEPMYEDFNNVHIINNYEEIIEKSKTENFIIIGGSEIYNMFIKHATALIVTLVNDEFIGDSWFPEYQNDFTNCFSFDFSSEIPCSLNLFVNNNEFEKDRESSKINEVMKIIAKEHNVFSK